MARRRKFARVALDPASLPPARGGVLIAALIGAGIGLLAVGWIARAQRVISDDNERAAALVFFGLFGGISAGLILPRHFAVRYVDAVRRRLERAPPARRRRPAPPAPPNERALLWLVSAVTCLAAGLTLAAFPLLALLGERCYRGLLSAFLWTPTPLLLVQCALIVPLSGLIGAVFGLVVNCTHRLACSAARWRIEPLAGLIAGAAGPVAVRVGSDQRTATICLILAALPLFVVAIVGVAAANRIDRSGKRRRQAPASPPEQRDRLPFFLQSACLIAGIGLLLTLHAPLWSGSSAGRAVPSPSIGMLAAAGGVAVGCRRRGRGAASERVGRSQVVAAIVLATAVLITERLRDADAAAPWRSRSAALCAAIAAALIAYALALGWRVMLDRSGSRSAAGTRCLALFFASAALVFGLIQPRWVDHARWLVCLTATAWLMAVTGAALLRSETEFLRDRRRRWVVAALAAVGLLAVVLPAARGNAARRHNASAHDVTITLNAP